MTDATIKCPECGALIPVSQVLHEQIRHEIEADLRRQARELEEAREALESTVEQAVSERLEQAVMERTEALLAEERARARREKALLEEQLETQKKKAAEAHELELALRKEKAELEQKAVEIDLELQRRLDAEKSRLEQQLRERIGQEQALRLKEKEKQIEDLRQALEDAKRRSELGSQELQGEVLELDIQASLEARFPQDAISPVPKGIRGADIVHEVRNSALQSCGTILWETKNTRHFQPAWLAKLKDDQRELGAAVAVLVSAVLPDEVVEFGLVEGVWVTGLRTWPAVALALREQLLQVAFVRSAGEGRNEKMDMLYDYLTGEQFRQRVAGIVEGFTALQDQIQKERRAMERQWREREKQIERVITNTVGLYGEMRGIVGTAIPDVPALSLDDSDLLEGPQTDG